MMDAAAAVRAAVGAVVDPELRRPLADLGMLRDISVAEGTASVGIALTIAGCPAAERIAREVTDAAASVAGVSQVDLHVGVMTPDERRELTELLRDGQSGETGSDSVSNGRYIRSSISCASTQAFPAVPFHSAA